LRIFVDLHGGRTRHENEMMFWDQSKKSTSSNFQNSWTEPSGPRLQEFEFSIFLLEF
jgi:hypothetical protein